MSASPSISVVVPTYNRAESVVRAVRSVLVQTFADLEVVVVDDGSTDATQAALAALDDPRLRYLSQANAGPSVARNTGAAAARSDAVIFLDSDDVAMPGWIGAHVEARTGDPVRLSRSGYLDLDAAGRLRSVVFARALTDAGHTQGTFIPGTFAIEKRLFEEVGGYEPALRFGENTELAVRVLRSWRAGQWRSTEIPRLLVRRQWSDRAAKYDDLKATTARFELEHHADVLRTHRESWSVRQSIVGVADARAGDLASARRAFLSAWRATPLRPRVAARAVAASVPPVARRVWSSRGARPSDVAVADPHAGPDAHGPRDAHTGHDDGAGRTVPGEATGPPDGGAWEVFDAGPPGTTRAATRAWFASVEAHTAGCDVVLGPRTAEGAGVEAALGDGGPLPPVGAFGAIRAEVAWMLGGVRADLAALRAAEVALRATAAGYVVRVEGAAPGGAEDRSLRSAVAAGAEEVRVAREYAAIGAHPAPLPRHPTLPTVAHILGRTRERLLHPLFGRIWSPGLR